MSRVFGRVMKSLTPDIVGVPILAFYGPVKIGDNLDCLRVCRKYEFVLTDSHGYFEMALNQGVYTLFALIKNKPYGFMDEKKTMWKPLFLRDGDFVKIMFE